MLFFAYHTFRSNNATVKPKVVPEIQNFWNMYKNFEFHICLGIRTSWTIIV